MTDLQIAKDNLPGHTICLCRDGNCLLGDKRGIAPMMDFIADGVELRGYSAADLVVGKAAAMLFARCGIRGVFAKTLSRGGMAILERYGIPFECEQVTDVIRNRAGTDLCPMEKAVLQTEDLEAAYLLLQNRLKILRGN